MRNRRDELANIAWAEELVQDGDVQTIQTLVTYLQHKNKDLRHDCVKILYEVGARDPKLIAPYDQDFLRLLSHKDNRLQWGAMTALDYLTPLRLAIIYPALPVILDAAKKGSVITRDHAVNILIHLAKHKPYHQDILPLLLELLDIAPGNQLPMYAEKVAEIFAFGDTAAFVALLQRRLPELAKDSQKKRIEKVFKKV